MKISRMQLRQLIESALNEQVEEKTYDIESEFQDTTSKTGESYKIKSQSTETIMRGKYV